MTWPRPTRSQLADLYQCPEYYALRGMASDAARASLERARQILASVTDPVENVLDFGAGCGHLVAAFRSLGKRAIGVEPSIAGRTRALEELGVSLAEDLPPRPGDGYDLITAIHSLEHVEQPLAVLRTLGLQLRSGGTMLIEVPHAGSIELWRPARRRWILDLPAHLYHFTPQSLRDLILAAGLGVRHTQLFNCDAIEWMLAWRAHFRQRVSATSVTVAGEPPMPHARGGSRPWAEAVLGSLRRLAPGWKFQIHARRE